jgi:hypothetical protein
MITNSNVRNVQKSFPPIQGLANGETLGKIRLKNIYPSWNGQNVNEIKAQHKNNPYLVRIGTPNTDEQLRSDRIYFMSHYLSYNPLTQDIENRDIITRRVMGKLHVGQTTLEGEYDNYQAFIAGNLVVQDIYLTKNESIKQVPLSSLLVRLMDKVDQLTKEIAQLKGNQQTKPIYIKDKSIDERIDKIPS